ncbi:MAG: 2-oxoacid:ferredoxin oxidoreductase subunit gamma [Ruminococcaceae bacterium]|nr:2-oxoacid:ferredoxin oxidoreductase subunit gamma [Oscillospiraceae bacterium]
MTTSIIFAGAGGQGIQFSGKQMAKTAMYCDMQVTFLPSYGPEMRGGTSNSTVVISDGEIGSPSVTTPDIVVAMNLPSFDKFEPAVKAGGILVIDSTLVEKRSERTDIRTVAIPATELAVANGLEGFANVIVLGQLIKVTGLFDYDTFLNYLVGSIPPAKAALIEKNEKALALGWGLEL